MGERKVQAKYYPPDFDPTKLPRIKKKRQNDDAVRFMLPMSVRCETCGEFMGTGLKFNARKADTGDDYLGIKIFRFSMKCKACPATFTIRTDPKNSDYSCESGVRRNYEPWREKRSTENEGKAERTRQDQDAMQALENKTMDAKQQMEELDALDEIKSNNARRAAIAVDDVIARGKELETLRNDFEERHMFATAKAAFERKNASVAPSRRRQSTDVNGMKMTADVRAPPREVLLRNTGFGLKVKKKIRKPEVKPAKNGVGKAPLVDYGASSDSE